MYKIQFTFGGKIRAFDLFHGERNHFFKQP